MNVKAITSTVKQKIHRSPHGCACIFVPINDKWAIKLYSNMRKRDFCHAMQTKAALFNLGPLTGNKVDLDSSIGPYHFGYLSEIVECYYEMGPDDVTNWYKEHGLAMKALREDLRKYISFEFLDHHPENVGFKNGTLVCIDFEQ